MVLVVLHRLPVVLGGGMTEAPIVCGGLGARSSRVVGGGVGIWGRPRGGTVVVSPGGLPMLGWRWCPTLPHPGGCSTIGVCRLSFRVRKGTGRFPAAMTTATTSGCYLLCLSRISTGGVVLRNRRVDAAYNLLNPPLVWGGVLLVVGH